jgi:hypothetical protein
MAGGERRRVAALVEVGWRDETPDVTTGEHDLLTAMLEWSWHDVQLDVDGLPPVRREETLAAKLTAYEWITSDEEHFLSFRSVCSLVGINDAVQARTIMLRGVSVPAEPIPERWRAELASTDRRDRVYTKRKRKDAPAPAPEPNAYTLEALLAEINTAESPATAPKAGSADREAAAASASHRSPGAPHGRHDPHARRR